MYSTESMSSKAHEGTLGSWDLLYSSVQNSLDFLCLKIFLFVLFGVRICSVWLGVELVSEIRRHTSWQHTFLHKKKKKKQQLSLADSTVQPHTLIHLDISRKCYGWSEVVGGGQEQHPQLLLFSLFNTVNDFSWLFKWDELLSCLKAGNNTQISLSPIPYLNLLHVHREFQLFFM